MENVIKIRGARQHNLKDVNLDIPKNKLVVFTGVSGSGKSSMAFDTIYAEGQRRYVESLSSYARQFLGVMSKPDVDLIEGLSPAISIDQKTVSHNPRSTVGTVTEIYDYLRLLFARVGHPHCPVCGREISSQSVEQIVEAVMARVEAGLIKEKKFRFYILSRVVSDKKGEFSGLFENLRAKGFSRVRVDGQMYELDDEVALIKTNKHTIDVVVDRISLTDGEIKEDLYKKSLESRLNDSIEKALQLSDGLCLISEVKDSGFEFPDKPKDFEDHLYSERFACPVDNISLPEIEPRMFSFNSPHGACPECMGIGRILRVEPDLVFSGELTVAEGGILPFSAMSERETWYTRLIKVVCSENGIDMQTPVKQLGERDIKILLEGTGKRTYEVFGENRFGRKTTIWERFDGIVAELTRRYASTESDYVRNAIQRYMREIVCPVCGGARLKKEALGVAVEGKSIAEVSQFAIDELYAWVGGLDEKLNVRERQIGSLVIKEILTRLNFLKSVGVEYLTLARGASTLAGGEAQRIRLASQIGSGLTGVLYVLDEPTIGLHPRDSGKLIETLKSLRDLGNSVVVVEHDRDMIKAADQIVDFGPGAGKRGGAVVCMGEIKQIMANKASITGKYLSGKRKISVKRVKSNGEIRGELKLIGASQNNLKGITLTIPLGKFVVVTGVSGSGKSSLVVDTLYHAVSKELNPYHRETAGEHKRIEGVDKIDGVVLIDQSPIGRTPRSNPATYTKIFDLIRAIYASTREAKVNGYKPGRFSFNVKGGRCEACEGQGQIKIEMQFMADIWVPCEVCGGKRYNSQTLDVGYHGKNIAEVLQMNVSEAKEFFHLNGGVVRKLETLEAVGLDYMELGQPATTMSGGEAQRIKLAAELGKLKTGKTLYILDEPTTGLHFADLEKLLQVLRILVDRGNTVVVIEHNLDVIANADWIVDLGPEGGEKGGEIVAVGRPGDIKVNTKSYTGVALNA